MKQVLTIAGSDSSGGAGIQADLKTMTAFNVYGASVITAVTAQNTLGVQYFEAVSEKLVSRQLESVLSDLDFSAVKTGMLANSKIIKIVAEKIKKYQLKNLVVDPVMVATSGDILLEKEAVKLLKEKLIPRARIITPNLDEAEVLTGKKLVIIGIRKLAKELHKLGSDYVLIKGGHKNAEYARDILYDGKAFTEFTVRRINTKNTHGTGCTLSAAIASNLARGYHMTNSVEKSKDFITEAIRAGCKVGHGINPVNHLIKI